MSNDSKHSAAANEYVEKILDGPTSERWDRFDIETAFQAGAESRNEEIAELNAQIESIRYDQLYIKAANERDRLRAALEDMADLSNPDELKYIAWPASEFIRKARKALGIDETK